MTKINITMDFRDAIARLQLYKETDVLIKNGRTTLAKLVIQVGKGRELDYAVHLVKEMESRKEAFGRYVMPEIDRAMLRLRDEWANHFKIMN